jgi:hypothetical protein
MSDTPQMHALLRNHGESWEQTADRLFNLGCRLEREVNDLRTDAARYRAVRGLYVGAGAKWSDTGVLFYSAACPPDEKYVRSDDFDQMADKLCEEPQ